MKRIYISGPYSATNVIAVFKNIRNGTHMAKKLLLEGYAVFCPWLDYNLFLQLNENEKISLETIQAHSMAWLEVSDAILVLPNHHQSKGTSAEIVRAKELRIPIYYSMEELMKGRNQMKENVENPINEISGLTSQEEKICFRISKICQLFNELPIQHQDDAKEWSFGIHILQGLLMQRIARRTYPRYWRDQGKIVKNS